MDRADRLSSRRKNRAKNQPEEPRDLEESEQQENLEHPDKPEKLEKLGKPDKQDEASDPENLEKTDEPSAKEQYKGTYMYLPEELKREFNLVASEVDTQRQRRNGKEVEKIRHFEPLIVSLGLEQIHSMSEEKLEKRLSKYDS